MLRFAGEAEEKGCEMPSSLSISHCAGFSEVISTGTLTILAEMVNAISITNNDVTLTNGSDQLCCSIYGQRE